MIGKLMDKLLRPFASWLYHKTLGMYGPRDISVPQYVINALWQWMDEQSKFINEKDSNFRNPMVRVENITFIEQNFYRQIRKNNENN